MEESQQKQEKSVLRLLREEAGLTRPQVKQLMGVSERMQADWESGKSTPTLENAAALARLYKISLKAICKAVGVDVAGVPDDEPSILVTSIDGDKKRRRSPSHS
jgi:transcriptional regulator with XRE-family HTH domain